MPPPNHPKGNEQFRFIQPSTDCKYQINLRDGMAGFFWFRRDLYIMPMLRNVCVFLALLLASNLWADEIPVDSVSADSVLADSLQVDSSAMTGADSAVVAMADSATFHLQGDSLKVLWFERWVGKVASVRLSKSTVKTGNYDPQAHRLPLTGKVQNGNLEFSLSGVVAMDDSTYLRLRKAKDWKVVVEYHDHSISLFPKKREKRVLLIDRVALEFEKTLWPVLGEIWLPAKIAKSPGYAAWRDSLIAQGVLRNASRGYFVDTRDQQKISWLRFDSLQWFSHYLSWDGPGSYPCTMDLVNSSCRRYDREDMGTLCPEGWNIPDSSNRQSLLQAWLADVKLPFEIGFRMWEIHSAEADEDSSMIMLYSPWSDSGRIEPNYWSYFETYSKDSNGQVGLFQFGWDESGVMSRFDVDSEDHVRHPLRCVRPLPLSAPPVISLPNETPASSNSL